MHVHHGGAVRRFAELGKPILEIHEHSRLGPILMNHRTVLAVVLIVVSSDSTLPADVEPPNAGRGAGTVPLWNPHRPAAGHPPLTVCVLVLNYDPLVPAEGHRRLSEVFRWRQAESMAAEYKEAMEYASGGYLRFEIAEWRNLNEIYAQEDGYRYSVEEYVRNRRAGKGWRKQGHADYPRLLREQNVVPLIDDGFIDEVWIFSDHFFGLWEASMAGPGAFFINGGVYPKVPSRRPFAFYGFNYERAVAEMMHNTSHRTEATLNRVYGPWNLKEPRNNWEKFSANHDQSSGLAGVGTCHWPANAKGDYDYGNPREVASWADAFLAYPRLELARKPVSRATWSRGPDYHLDYMKWYFAHIPRAAGVNEDRRQNNWYKYIFDFQSYDEKGQARPASAELHLRDVADADSALHEIVVAYRSAEHVDPATIDDNDLSVTAPDGKALTVKLLRGNEPGGRSYCVARYRVQAPNGSWDKSPAGEYLVNLRANEVRTSIGAALPGTRLGSFRVAHDVQTLAVEVSSEPLLAGSRAVVRARAKTKAGLTRDVTRDVAWTSSDAKVAMVDDSGTLRTGRAGEATLTARLGARTAAATIKVVDPGLPTARLLSAASVMQPGPEPVTVRVRYDDPDGIRRETLGRGDIRVVGPHGFHQFPELASVEPSAGGFTATYRVRPAAGQWRPVDRGTYIVEMMAFQVADAKGHHVPAGVLGEFRVLQPVNPR